MRSPSFLQRHRRWLIGLVVAAALLLFLTLLLLTFGWAYLRRPLETQLSRQIGRPVTIASIGRVDHSFLFPVVEVRGVRVAQPDWVGGGDMVTIRRATAHLRLLSLLAGRAHPDSIAIDGLRVALVRRDSTHANWKGLKGGSKGGGSLAQLTITDGMVTLDDAKRDHRFTARLTADRRGFRLAGTGTLAGHASTLRLSGGPVGGDGPWPFRFDYRSAIANGTLVGRADHALDIGHMTARATAWGDDLAHLDLLIEAGLPGTQPARLTADLRHDRPDWTIRNLRLTLGRSDFAGDVTVQKRLDRSIIDASVVSRALNFDDLASDAGLRHAAAKRRATGPRIIPDTAIGLQSLQQTDAVLRFDVRRLLTSRPGIVRGMHGTLTLDHGVLEARPLTISLLHGQARGSARVEHRSGFPRMSVDLRLAGARLEDLVRIPDGATGAVRGRVVLSGQGETIRAAMSVASGRAALVARDGSLSRRNALLLGTDAGRALFADKEARTPLTCIVASFTATRGIARPTPFVIDTPVSRVDGGGTVNLANERLALSVRGRPKLRNAVALDEPIGIAGTLYQPQLLPPAVPKTVGTALKLIGNAIAGGDARRAPDADCAALAARALR
jgi:AsmA family protein